MVRKSARSSWSRVVFLTTSADQTSLTRSDSLSRWFMSCFTATDDWIFLFGEFVEEFERVVGQTRRRYSTSRFRPHKSTLFSQSIHYRILSTKWSPVTSNTDVQTSRERPNSQLKRCVDGPFHPFSHCLWSCG